MAGRDHARGRIDADEYRDVVQSLREILEAVVPVPAEDDPPPTSRVFGAAARGEADAVGLVLLRGILRPAGVELHVVSPDLLSSEVVGAARAHGGDVLVVGALPPGGVAQARYLCKRLRAGTPNVRIVVARLSEADAAAAVREALRSASADEVGFSLTEMRELILQLVRVRPDATPQHAA
jgi:hypothetical protein